MERSIFPAEMLLGICHSTTPALRDWIGRFMADAGASQDAVVSWLKASLSVTMSVKRLRQVTEHLSDAMGELRQVHQVQRLLDLLREAGNSRGSRKPVLAVGRDGITLRQYANSLFEVATAATISVYDRAGKPLGTVYLAWPPELGQATMDQMLTDILLELFEEWTGPLPRLAYVSDCGSNESGYFEGILRKMRHPRTTDVLHWIRVVDYYHVSERIWAMATALFGKDTQHAWGWARRMLKALKKRNGPSRVLHSAASQRKKIKRMSQTRQDDFDKAINYLRPRTKFMRYHECSSNHIPIGSGVTEAACKTIYTQRLKLSGMRWSFEGAKSVVTLRTILLSKTWDATYADYLKSLYPADLQTYQPKRVSAARRAA